MVPRRSLDALLDSQWAGLLSCAVDGEPLAVPMLYARDGDRILLHGSTGAGALRHVATGASAVLTVFTVDALVVAPTTFESSVNYRSATVRGRLDTVEDRERALDLFSDAIIPGADRRGAAPEPQGAGRHCGAVASHRRGQLAPQGRERLAGDA